MSLAYPVLLIASTAGYLLFLTTRMNLRFTQAPFIFCCFVCLLQYTFGILGALQYGAFVSLGVGLILLIASNFKVIQSIKLKEINFNNLVSGILYVAPFIAYFLAISKEFRFLLWDEFSFWASSQKLIFETNALYQENSPLFIKSYPPAQQLIQYYFTKFTFWSEKNVLFAQIAWILAALMCISGTIIQNKLVSALAFISACTFLYFFNYGIVSIYSDQLLGLIFATSVTLAFTETKGSSNALILALAIGCLLLMKEIAVLLVMIVLAIYLTMQLIKVNEQSKKIAQIIIKASISFLAVALFAWLIQTSWGWYVASINASRTLDLTVLTQITEPSQSIRFTKTLVEFIYRLFKNDYISLADVKPKLNISIAKFVVSQLILSILIVIMTPRVKRVMAVGLVIILLLGAIAYTGALTFTYFVFFTEYEGVRLASFERYLSTYMLAWAVIIYMLFIESLSRFRKRYSVIAFVVVFSSMFYYAPRAFYADLKRIQPAGQDLETRNKIEQLAQRLKKIIKSDEKAYFIAQNSNGLERTMFYYAVLPAPISMEWCWSLGKKYFDGDVWTCDTHLSQVLKDYDYLAIYKADEQFWKNNGDLFDLDSKNFEEGIFKINRANGKIISISKVN